MRRWRLWITVTLLAGCATTPTNRPDALRLLKVGQALRAEEDYVGAAYSFAAAVRADPTFGRPHMELGVEYLRSGLRTDDAIDAFKEALDCDPSLWQAKQYWVDALRLEGDLSDAISLQAELVETVGEIPEVHHNMGNLLLAQKEWGEAEVSFRRALALRSDYALARGGLGIALWRSGNIDDGAAALREAVTAYPRNALLALELARALCAAERFEEAQAAVKQAHDLEPRNGLVYHVMAEIHLAQGRLEAARTLARRAVANGCPLASELKEQLGPIVDTENGGEQ